MKHWFRRILPFLLYALFFLPSIIRSFQGANGQIDLFNDASNYFYSIFYNLVILLVTLIALIKIEKKTIALCDLSFPSLSKLSSIFFYLVFIIAFSYLLSLFLSFFTPDQINERVPFNNPNLIPLLLISMLAVGYMEEIFFRGYLLFSFDSWLPQSVSIIISTFLFSIGHGYQGLAAIPGTFLLGLIFVWIRKKEASLHIPAITHALYNTFIVLVTSEITFFNQNY